jgi:hypothetical protein
MTSTAFWSALVCSVLALTSAADSDYVEGCGRDNLDDYTNEPKPSWGWASQYDCYAAKGKGPGCGPGRRAALFMIDPANKNDTVALVSHA